MGGEYVTKFFSQMHAVEENQLLSEGTMKKNWKIPINLPILTENRYLKILVQKMHTGHEEKQYYPCINNLKLKYWKLKKIYFW